MADLAATIGPGERMPTVGQMRQAMGVSVATLNSALNELEARKLIDRRNGVGIFASSNVGKRVISLVCDPLFFQSGAVSQFWTLLIDQARDRAESHNELLEMHFTTISGETQSLPTDFVRDIEAGRIDGVLYVGTFKQGVSWIEQQGTPVVVFAGPGGYRVEIDSEAVIEAGAASLATAGCRRIALWPPDFRVIVPEDVDVYRNAVQTAFQRGLTAGNAPYIPELIRDYQILVKTGPWFYPVTGQSVGYSSALHAFQQPRDTWPDGIVIPADTMTLGVVGALGELDLRLGEDVQIATQANRGSSLLLGWEDKLTILQIDPEQIVTGMFDCLEQLMIGANNISAVRKIRPVVPPTTTAHVR